MPGLTKRLECFQTATARSVIFGLRDSRESHSLASRSHTHGKSQVSSPLQSVERNNTTFTVDSSKTMEHRVAISCSILASIIIAASAATPQSPHAAKSPKTLFKSTHLQKQLHILGVFPFRTYSHYQMFQAVMMALVDGGHKVTVFSPFKLKKPVQNYTLIDLSKELPPMRDAFQFTFAAELFGSDDVAVRTKSLADVAGVEMCNKTFNHPFMKEIIAGKHKFDVVFTEIFATDCLLAVGYKLKIPTISLATTYNLQWTADYIGDVDNPAFYESMYIKPSPEGLRTFWRRLENTRLYILTKLAYYWYMDRPQDALLRELFGDDFPSLSELKRNVSLVLANSHDILIGPKPTVPRFLEVSGIHIREPDFSTVSKEIKAWLDEAPNGVLYFTLGSILRSDSLPQHVFKAFTAAFAKLKPLRVLWKYESSKEHAKAAGVPDNVMVEKWLPQMEILAHPNVKGFMTHGGLMGCLEAAYNGVPLIGLPVFADQAANVAKFVELGVAVAMDHATLNEETAYNTIKKGVSDPKIRQRAKELSARFRDRPIDPADAVVWWTEYIERYGGAPFLEAPGSYMPLYQYLLLDVIGAALLALVVVLAALVYIIKLVIRMIRPSSPSTASNKKKN